MGWFAGIFQSGERLTSAPLSFVDLQIKSCHAICYGFSGSEASCRQDAVRTGGAFAPRSFGARIDDIIPADADIQFMKIDIEGYEYKALCGAAGRRSCSKPGLCRMSRNSVSAGAIYSIA
ncbi:MAG: hypothetical protein GC153_08975 [Alphaproteobacteria bacterium]|nr:hypothetical protein [Alphaproteobacteria bacterium]